MWTCENGQSLKCKIILLDVFFSSYLTIGPCDIQNLRVVDSGNSIRLYWDCNRPDNIFDITYQLIDVGTCDTENVTGFPVIDLTSPNSRYFSISDLNMYANATYLFTVHAKYWQPESGYAYGPRPEEFSFTTPELPESRFDKWMVSFCCSFSRSAHRGTAISQSSLLCEFCQC